MSLLLICLSGALLAESIALAVVLFRRNRPPAEVPPPTGPVQLPRTFEVITCPPVSIKASPPAEGVTIVPKEWKAFLHTTKPRA